MIRSSEAAILVRTLLWVCLTFFRSADRGLHAPTELTREATKHQARKRRASERPRVGRCEELAGSYWRWPFLARAPDSKNLNLLRAGIRPVVKIVVSTDQENTPYAWKFNIFGNSSNLGILCDEFECSAKFLTKEIWCPGAVAPPPAGFLADLLSCERCRKYSKCHRSIRLIQLCEEFVGIDKFAAVCLSDG